ncbi:MAG: 30S ribosome-binding factor RbfA [Bacillota bacterium]|nr:30S ribosome-binding factor RbfA [Bacillota bacterium]
MGNHRNNRLAGEIQREISQIIRDELKDPRIGFITITGVEVSGDLRHAKVFISIMGDDSNKQNTLGGLNKAAGFIRTELARRISLRYTPELHFRVDESLDYSEKINKIISETKGTEV